MVSGTIEGTSKGSTSKVVIGNIGVFKVKVNNIAKSDRIADVEVLRTEGHHMITARSDYEAFNAIKEEADIEIHKSRID